MQEKTNCIIIHGCPPNPKELIDINDPGSYSKHWIPYVKKELTLRDIHTETPLMPAPWAPDYEAFKKEFEKYEIDENTILIGHSCGCAFLVQWLGDTKQKIKKLILVAPWKIDTKNNDFKKNFYNFDIDKTIPERVKEIVMFTSDNEHSGGPESLEMYHQALGGRVITLPGHGHYIFRDMGTKEFPELLEEII